MRRLPKGQPRPAWDMLWLLFFCLVLTGTASARDGCTTEVASTQGRVESRGGRDEGWSRAAAGDLLCPGTQVRVGRAGRATLLIRNADATERAYLRLRQGTVLTLPEHRDQGRFFLRLEGASDGESIAEGALHFISRTRRELKIETPFVNAYVEGTEVAVSFDRARAVTDVTVFEGCVLVTARDFETGAKQDCRLLAANVAADDLLLERYQSARAGAAESPRRRLELAPTDAIKWSLYYPPLPGPAGLEAVEDLLLAGEADEALARLESMGAGAADYHALRAVIFLARGELDQAEKEAEAAVSGVPMTLRAGLSRSYVHQARGRIDPALETVERLATDYPGMAFLWARIAELRLSTGDRAGSLAAANESLRLDPDSAHGHAVLGFSRLAVADHVGAEERFNAAITADPSDPLARLGLGLAHIRRGDLARGRELLELAAMLAPGDAVIRSYLGKAYSEENRNRRARDQFDLATDLFGPNDPTAWFYRALLEVVENRPAQALLDLEASVARNDNRAVYRSRLLLDEDNAVRSTGSARIYQELGFNDRALLEGARALIQDPASHSAHRFMADVQSTRRGHEITRTSELLQAQLLQPVNISPTQPILAETGLLVLDGSGPVSVSAGEFHPLFTRNQTVFYLSGVLGSQNTVGNEATVTALHDNLVVSATQYHYRNDGFRDNQDIEHNITDGFFQIDLSPGTSVQLEARRRRTASGDRVQRINPDDFLPNQRRAVESDTVRVGVRHSSSPRTTMLASVAHQQLHEPVTSTDSLPALGLEIVSDFDRPAASDQIDLRFIHRLGDLNVDAGIGYQYQDAHFGGRVDVTVLALPAASPPPMIFYEDADSKHVNAFTYLNGTALDRLHWTVGLGFDDPHGAPRDRRRFSPKLGILWDLGHGFSARLAAFKGVRRPVIDDRVLEPTQIAGFDQFFDDSIWSSSEAWGAGVDYRFGNLSAGGSVFRRDVTSYGVDPVFNRVLDLDHREGLARLYFGAFLTSHLAFTASLEYEALDREFEGDASRPVRMDTRTLPLALRWFLDDGMRVRMSVTGVDQDVDFVQPNSRADASAHFWVTDLRLEKDLPARSGYLFFTALNLLDRDFRFQDTDFNQIDAREPLYAEDLSVFLGVNLAID